MRVPTRVNTKGAHCAPLQSCPVEQKTANQKWLLFVQVYKAENYFSDNQRFSIEKAAISAPL